jgi:hypothetical protein
MQESRGVHTYQDGVFICRSPRLIGGRDSDGQPGEINPERRLSRIEAKN